MRHTTHLTRVAVLTAAALLASCSKPASPPKTPEAPAAAPPPAAAAPATASSTIDAAIAANIGDPAKFRELVTTLRQAVQNHDAAAVATLVNYPIDINPHTKYVLHIRTPAAFIAHYDQIVTPHIADVITSQKYDDLFVNAQGSMFGNGELWISGVCQDKTCSQIDIKIRTIQNTDGASQK